jgi:hypothetical protein
MITNQFKASVVLVLILLIFSIAAKAVGTLQPPNPALEGFTAGCEDKPFLCWYGIVPGVTSVEEGHELLNLEFHNRSRSSNRYEIDFFKSGSLLACPGKCTL